MNVTQRHHSRVKPGQIFGPGAMRALGREIANEALQRKPQTTPPSRQSLRHEALKLAKQGTAAAKAMAIKDRRR